jgi:hypothetical protein
MSKRIGKNRNGPYDAKKANFLVKCHPHFVAKKVIFFPLQFTHNGLLRGGAVFRRPL